MDPAVRLFIKIVSDTFSADQLIDSALRQESDQSMNDKLSITVHSELKVHLVAFSELSVASQSSSADGALFTVNVRLLSDS